MCMFNFYPTLVHILNLDSLAEPDSNTYNFYIIFECVYLIFTPALFTLRIYKFINKLLCVDLLKLFIKKKQSNQRLLQGVQDTAILLNKILCLHKKAGQPAGQPFRSRKPLQMATFCC